ncbi:MAG: PKD domain-containing protein, partial [Sphingobacteriales bacterium]
IGIHQSQAQCNAQFNWAQAPQNNNLLRVAFTNTSTAGGSGMQVRTIHFGDGTPTQSYNGTQSHNYSAPGTYSVIVGINKTDSITPANNCHDSITSTVTVSYPTCGTSITTVNNGSGSYTFTANTPAGTSGMTYTWNFGDGNYGSGNTVTHTYSSGGSYNVMLQAVGSGCTYGNQTNVFYLNSTINCDSLSANFTTAINGLQVQFYNTSTPVNFTQLSVSNESEWFFGDGGTANSIYPSHNYSAPGTYTVTMVNHWVDSFAGTQFCVDTTIQQVTVNFPVGPNVISGTIHWNNPSSTDSISSFKVWLIEHDASANTLTAVDSDMVYSWNAHYAFNGPAVGSYLVKAAPVFVGAVSAYGVVPTYHDSSLYWSGASAVSHLAGATTGKDIWMRNGTITAGPGFVGGNISSGAGKGTGTGVPGLLVFLRNSVTNKLVSSAYTDANGDYSFSNIAIGSYNVYPEAMSYATTPSAALSVTAGQTSNTGVDFVQTEDQIIPKGLGIAAITKDDGISIYPNPASDVLVIENKAGKFNQVSIVNTLGQVVKKQKIFKGNNKVEITNMNSGLYYVIISGNEGARSVKISKK